MRELRRIPNVGKRTEQDLLAMGYTTIASLKGKSGEELYAEECALRGFTLDRCQLYLLRAVAYFVNAEAPAPEKCAWHLWTDDTALPSPCGAVCAECAQYPALCSGCRKFLWDFSLPSGSGIVFSVRSLGSRDIPWKECSAVLPGIEDKGFVQCK